MALAPQLEQCPDCRVELPKLAQEAPAHRYIGASPSCWALFANLFNGGNPPIEPAPTHALLLDAYAAQHPGVPTPQAIQSVAVHLLVLHGVLHENVAPSSALWIRKRALRPGRTHKHERFQWLTPPDFTDCLKVADIVREETPAARSEKAAAYVRNVWSFWAREHLSTLAQGYAEYVA